MNAPDSFASFLLLPGESRISYESDTKVRNAGTFRFNREDHTLGNLLRTLLLRDKRVLFAAYKVPHPLEHHILLRIQTTDDTTPQDVLSLAVNEGIKELQLLEQSFVEQVASTGYGARGTFF